MAQTASRNRRLIVMADDFGIGPQTSQAILDLAAEGKITGTVLIVNSPYAADAVNCWKRSGISLEVGWHPNLTLDRPISAPDKVPSLVQEDGTFHQLGAFMKRLMLGRIRWADAELELHAQYKRFIELLGYPPGFLNGHQHIHVFSPIAEALGGILERQTPRPYVRRVREPWSMFLRVPGARLKRILLYAAARRTVGIYDSLGCPGNDCLAGITDPPCVKDPRYLTRWLTKVPGQVVELACHPGYWDETLDGRDCEAGDGKAQRRVDELELMNQPDFTDACRQANFQLLSIANLLDRRSLCMGRAA
jgi:predicted glycoside hydrolase/deacetylase ChbG (UPF0249 family)